MREISGVLGSVASGQMPSGHALGALVGFVLYILIILFLGEYLWNNVLAKVVTVVKPIQSVWQLLGLMILFGLII